MQSPLGSPIPPSDVAEDFKESLKDLHFNNRVEINTLTMIAKENSEHAFAISRVLETHIKTVAPPRKLPALYVLDSIVKNVGAPYTIYLGQNLYSTFIDAYTAVDSRTRGQMENMLQLWKSPVPGSMDARPVFPVDTTSAIQNALQKAKAAFQQQQQQQQKQPQVSMYRQPHALPPRPSTGNVSQSWGTPPVNGARYPPPPQPGGSSYPTYPNSSGYSQNGYAQYQQMPSYYQQPPQNAAYPTPVPQQQHYYQTTPPTPYQPPLPPDFAKVNADIESLIETMKYKLATNMHDSSLQARLQAMLDLKDAITRKSLSQQEWESIRNRLGLLIQQENSPPYNIPPYTRQAPASNQFPQASPSLSQTPLPTSQPTTHTSYADLLASLAPQRASPPQARQPSVPPPTTLSNGIGSFGSPTAEGSSNNLAKDNDLISSLIKSITPAMNQQQQTSSRSNSTQANSAYMPPPTSTAPLSNPSAPALPNDLSALLAQLSGSTPAQTTQSAKPSQPVVDLSHESIKIPRLDLINRRLYRAAPSQCMTCGRRFPRTPEGKVRKARHLDYHFRTNARINQAEAAGRQGVCRAWLPGIREWVSAREWDDADETVADKKTSEGEADANADANGADKKKKDTTPYVRVPDQGTLDDSVRKGQPMNVCPICQDEFNGVWHDGAQEWVWLDAVKAGTRIYHASCYAEVKRDQEKSRGMSFKVPPPPGGVLGKRKMDVELEGEGQVRKSPKQEVEVKS